MGKEINAILGAQTIWVYVFWCLTDNSVNIFNYTIFHISQPKHM